MTSTYRDAFRRRCIADGWAAAAAWLRGMAMALEAMTPKADVRELEEWDPLRRHILALESAADLLEGPACEDT